MPKQKKGVKLVETKPSKQTKAEKFDAEEKENSPQNALVGKPKEKRGVSFSTNSKEIVFDKEDAPGHNIYDVVNSQSASQSEDAYIFDPNIPYSQVEPAENTEQARLNFSLHALTQLEEHGVDTKDLSMAELRAELKSR